MPHASGSVEPVLGIVRLLLIGRLALAVPVVNPCPARPMRLRSMDQVVEERVTVNFGGAVTIQSLSIGAFTGTFDNSVNNNNFTLNLSGSASVFVGSGNLARTYKLGTATYTLSGTIAGLNFGSIGNLTFSGAGSTISFTGTGLKIFTTGNLTWGGVSFGASSGNGYCQFPAGSCTITTLAIAAPNNASVAAGIGLTLTNPLTLTGSASSQIGLMSNSVGSQVGLTVPAGSTATWCAFRDMGFSNTLTATNSFDLLNNGGVTITPPSGGGGGGSGPSFSATIF